MPAVQTEFDADFFNNIAAVAVVLMFTKVVTHRGRKVQWDTRGTRRLALLHTLAVVAALAAIIISLLATHSQPDGHAYHYFAWACLAIAAVILLGDHVYDELKHAFCRTSSSDPSAKPGEADTDSS